MASWAAYDWTSRTIKRHRGQIREADGLRMCGEEDQAQLAEWLAAELCPVELSRDRLAEGVALCRSDHMEPMTTPGQLGWLAGSAVSTFEDGFTQVPPARHGPTCRWRTGLRCGHGRCHGGSDPDGPGRLGLSERTLSASPHVGQHHGEHARMGHAPTLPVRRSAYLAQKTVVSMVQGPFGGIEDWAPKSAMLGAFVVRGAISWRCVPGVVVTPARPVRRSPDGQERVFFWLAAVVLDWVLTCWKSPNTFDRAQTE